MCFPLNSDSQSALGNEMKEAIARCDEATERLMQANPDQFQYQWNEWKQSCREYQAAHKSRQREIFQKTADMLAEPGRAGTFMKIVSGIRRRDNNVSCCLDTKKMDTHRQHFKKTFGADPIRNTENAQLLPSGIREMLVTNESQGIGRRELQRIISWYPNGKSPGMDQIFIEMIKLGGDGIVSALLSIMNACRDWKVVPDQWTESMVALVYKKKGDPQNVANYRPIAMTSICRRIYEKFLMVDFGNDLDALLCPEQSGFRKNRGTLEQVFALHETMIENNELCVAFLDIKAAYDTVNRDILWAKLVGYGVNIGLIENLRALFDHNTATLAIKGKLSSPIKCRRGLLQGSAISPVLFSLFINDLITRLNETWVWVQVRGISLNSLLYADDGAIMAKDPVRLQLLLNVCEQWSLENGIEFAPAKCVVISATECRVQLYDQAIPQHQSFKYLGMVMNKYGIDWHASTYDRIKNASMLAGYLHSRGMNASGWRIRSSVQAVTTFIRPMMEYGIQLGPPLEVCEQMQKVLGRSVKLALSVRFRSGTDASVKTLGITDMWSRRNELWTSFFKKYYEEDPRLESTPACMIFHNSLQLDVSPDSCIYKIQQSEWFNISSKKELLKLRESEFESRHTHMSSSNARSIVMKTSESDIDFYKVQEMTREIENAVAQWKSGDICIHQACRKCGSALSRAHGEACSEIEGIGAELIPEILSEWKAIDN
jgi:hypothetical protein